MRPVPTLSSALPAGGGFFLPSYDTTSASSSSSSSTNLAPLPTEPQDALRLSPVQLTRLRSHLDSRILSIQRRWAKRFHHHQQHHQQTFNEGAAAAAAAAAAAVGEAGGISTSDPLLSGGPALDSVGKYVSAWTDEVLPLLVRVDPVGASQSTTLVAYAMRMTELLLVGIVGYESLEEREAWQPNGDQDGDAGAGEGGHQHQHQQQPPTSGLTRVLQALHLLDALWASLLAGRRLSLPHALARSSASLCLASSNTSSSSSSAAAAPSAPGAPAPTRDSVPLSGSLGIKTLSGTDRVRLRNLLVDRRSEVRGWVGGVLGLVLAGPAPGEEEERQERLLPGGGSSRLSGLARGSMSPMQGRRKKRGRAALIEPQDSTGEASQRDGIAEEVQEESDGEKADVLEASTAAAAAAVPAAKRRKRTRGDIKRASQIKQEAINDDDDEEEDMEEVTVPASAANGTGPQAEQRLKQDQVDEEDKADEAEMETEEHRHYQALFDRKIELDEDEDEDEDDEDDDGEQEDRDEGQNEGEVRDAQLDPQHAGVNGNGNGNGNGEGAGDSIGDEALPDPTGGADTATGRLGSFELDVLLARLFSRSLALLERLE